MFHSGRSSSYYLEPALSEKFPFQNCLVSPWSSQLDLRSTVQYMDSGIMAHHRTYQLSYSLVVLQPSRLVRKDDVLKHA